MKFKAMSLGQQLDKVHQAVYEATQPPPMPTMEYVEGGYAVAVFDAYVIIRADDKFWKADYTLADGEVTLADRANWVEVESQWVAVKTGFGTKNDEMLVSFGQTIKALGNGKIGGYLVHFTDADHPDLTGDFFTKDTEFDIEPGEKTSIYYNHGMDAKLKTRKLGNGKMSIDDTGVWIEAQLQLRDEYEQAIYQMVESGKMGWSSGTLSHLVEAEPVGKSQWIKHWPLGKDASITPTPAAGAELTKVLPLKSWIESQVGQQALAQTAGDAVTQSATDEKDSTVDTSKAKRLALELDLLSLGD